MTTWTVSLALCAWCAAQGAQAADAAKAMSFDDCKAVLEKLKADGKIKRYNLGPGENGMVRLDLGESEIADLTPLKGMPLSDLVLSGTKATDLSPLLECPDLEKLVIPEGCTDLEPLRKMKNLKFISNHFDWWTTHAEDFWKAHDNPGWPKMKTVLDKLQADGTIKQYKLDPGENGLSKLDLSHSGIIDLAPLKGMPLESLHIDGTDQDTSKVTTLAGLEGMPLKELSLSGNVALEDISAIKGVPLKVFVAVGCHAGNPKLKDISALKGMQLKVLHLTAPVADLSPLAGMPLEDVVIGCAVDNVNVLKGMPVKRAHIAGGTGDLSGLAGCPLNVLSLHGNNKCSDLSFLKGAPLNSLFIDGAPIADLSPLKGLPLKEANLEGYKGADISPLAECPDLERLAVTPNCKDLEPLRKLKNLKSLNNHFDWWTTPAQDFWKRYDEAKGNT